MATGLENLNIYNIAKELELKAHHLIAKFPKEERFRSVDQLKRSSSSIANNIAESYYKRLPKTKEYILRDVVLGELEETRTNLLRCSEKGFLSKDEALKMSDEYIILRKAIFGYIRFLKTHQLLN